jgi:hypothetical protein
VVSSPPLLLLFPLWPSSSDDDAFGDICESLGSDLLLLYSFILLRVNNKMSQDYSKLVTFLINLILL